MRVSLLNRLVSLFPLWAVGIAVLAVAWPGPWRQLSPAIVPLLGVVMFGMGLTLRGSDFLEVVRRPQPIAAGTALQFGIMPLAAWITGHALQLPPELLAGLILVGACPGGTASNVVTYLARGDVALSITLTFITTLLAVFLTPALMWLYAGTIVPVPVEPMLLSILNVVILPVLGGLLVNHFFGSVLDQVKVVFPLASVAAIVAIIGIVVALNADRLAASAGLVAVAVVLHNAMGLGAGYGVARLLGFDARTCRTISIEVGMQNSGLGAALATQFFSATAALPGAVFSVWHNLSGSLLAGYWSRRARTQAAPQPSDAELPLSVN